MARVLLLDGDTRQVLPVMRALRVAGHHVTVACDSRISVGWFSILPHRRVKVPSPVSQPGQFLKALIDLLRDERYDVTIPLVDICASLVVEHKAELEQYTRMPVPDHDVFMLARDKANTMRICQEKNIPCPRTYFPEEQSIAWIRDRVNYPVLVKPRIGHGAIGIFRVSAPEELESVCRKVEKEYAPCIVQELIPQTGLQYKVQLFRDREGGLRAAVVFNKLRYFPVTGGTSSINCTVRRDDIVEICRQLLEEMRWTGYADVDLIEDPRDGVPKVMEVNPRVTGSVKIAFEAGVDFADLLVRFAQGDRLPTYNDYRVGIYMRYIPLDILWFLYSRDRFRAEPSWLKFWGRDLCYQVLSLRDPGPFLALGLSGLARLTSPKVRAEKLKKDTSGAR
jgi:predicted ATP-grasp superfamily ATP-dependent carboligase